MSYIDNHVALGLGRLLEQYKNRLRIGKFLTSLLTRYQLLENTLNDIDNNVRLQTATGEVLDRIGVNFNVTRNQLPDNLYRQKIYISILINRSKGNVVGILNAIRLLYNPQSVYIVEYNCLVQINMRLPTNIYNIDRILPAIVAAGVAYSVVYETAHCGSLASLTIGNIDFEVDGQGTIYDLLTDADRNFQVKSQVIKIPKNVFKLGMRIINIQEFKTSEGIYFVDDTEELNVLRDISDHTLIKGSDLAIRIL